MREGLAATGNVITAAAGIMILVFGSFVLSPDRMLQQMGLGLAVAVLVDALIIRCMVVPAFSACSVTRPGGCQLGSIACCPASGWNYAPASRVAAWHLAQAFTLTGPPVPAGQSQTFRFDVHVPLAQAPR